MPSPQRVGAVPRFGFSGYYGMSNFGDELFAALCLWGAASYWGARAPQVVGPSPHGGDARSSLVPSWWPASWYQSRGWIGRLTRLTCLLRAFRRCDVVVLGGGSTLASGSSLRTRSFQASAARRRWIELAAIGVSVGPFVTEADARVVGGVLSKLAFLSVRDRASVRRIHDIAPRLTPTASRDLAGLLPRAYPLGPRDAPEPGTLGVALSRVPGAAGERTLQRLADGIVRHCKLRNGRVRLFCLNRHSRTGDQREVERMVGLLREDGIDAQTPVMESPEQTWRRIAACERFVSVRLHGAIAAYMAQVPFVLLEYHDKCSDFLDDIGQPEALRLGRTIDDSARTAVVLDRLERNPGAPKLPPETYAAEAELNFTAAPWALRDTTLPTARH